MSVDEAEPPVEAVGSDTRPVGRQLHDRGAPSAGLVDRPGDHRRAYAATAVILTDADGFDLGARGAATR